MSKNKKFRSNINKLEPIQSKIVSDIVQRDELHFQSHSDVESFIRPYQEGELEKYPRDISNIEFMLVIKHNDKTHARIPLTAAQRERLMNDTMPEQEWAEVAGKAVLDIL